MIWSPPAPSGKDDDVDLRAGQELLGRIAEKQQRDVAGLERFVRPVDEVHPSREFDERRLRPFRIQSTADLLQKGADERQTQVVDARRTAHPIVERNRGRQTE